MQPEGEQAKESIYAMIGGEEKENKVAVHGQKSQKCELDPSSLLIDLRDKQEYDAWHIVEAHNWPVMLINQDKTFP